MRWIKRKKWHRILAWILCAGILSQSIPVYAIESEKPSKTVSDLDERILDENIDSVMENINAEAEETISSEEQKNKSKEEKKENQEIRQDVQREEKPQKEDAIRENAEIKTDGCNVYQNGIIKIYHLKQLRAIGSGQPVKTTDDKENTFGTGHEITENGTVITYSKNAQYQLMNDIELDLVLEDRVAKAIQDAGKSMKNRKYQSKYLDLVQDQDGNLWVSSSKGSVVTWPYPEGTDETTDFDLYHFRGLHREYGIKGNAEEEEAVYTAPQEKVEIEKTEDGIRFFIPESGFSPFVLTWTDGVHKNTKPSKPGNKNPIGNIVESVKTGDHAAIGFIFLVVLVSGSVVVLLIRNRKKNKKFF